LITICSRNTEKNEQVILNYLLELSLPGYWSTILITFSQLYLSILQAVESFLKRDISMTVG